MKKRVLCYGDSNTYGYNPLDTTRYDEDVRWPMVMQTKLGDGYRVIEEGLNGRTFCNDDPTEGGGRSGISYLPACLKSHNPIDLFIVMLGTNDAKERFGLNAATISCNLMNYAKAVREYAFDSKGAPSKILVVSPPLIGDISHSIFYDHFGLASVEKAKGFAAHYRRYTKLLSCEFFDAASCAKPCKIDAVHLMPESHLSLANALCDKVKEILDK